ncbi:MAG: hypothetical protein HY901_23145 [Deltaproteobacteria bacterium]|nr:hypothetical protein [Deltaproteobacteria bacterium]
MAESIKISSVADSQTQVSTTDLTKEHSDKLQGLGSRIISSFFMLVRSVKMYDPDNAIFQKPLSALEENINQYIAVEGRLDLQMATDTFYLNGTQLKMDVSSLESVRFLQQEMKEKNVGGFTLVRAVHLAELKNFISIFATDRNEQAEEDGLGDKKLVQIKLIKFSQIKERLKNLEETDQKIDRKKYALTCYARCVFFLRKYLEKMKAGKPMPAVRCARLIQDLVDVCFEQRTHFLGMTSLKDEADYHVFHQVNVALITIVVGNEQQLTKAQRRDLGMIALFHETGMSSVSGSLLKKTGALTADERGAIQKGGVETLKQILAEKTLSRQSLMRLVVTSEHRHDFGNPVKDSRGNIQMIIPKGHLSVYAKLISIACVFDALTSKRPYRDAYGPEIALTLMWTELRHKFDPELLKVFMKVMAIQPIRVLPKNRQTVAIG